MREVSVCVVMPARDAASTVERALKSIERQQRPPSEVIVVDDVSTDGTAGLAEDFDWVRMIRGTGRGAASARNLAIMATSAEYLAFLDADDAWLPGYLATAAPFLDDGVDLLLSDRVEVSDISGRITALRTVDRDLSPRSVLLRNTIATSGVIIHRNVVVDSGLFNEEVRYCEDLELWIRILASRRRIAFNPTPTVYVVRDSWKDAAWVADMAEHRERVAHWACAFLDLDPDTRSLAFDRVHKDIAWTYLKHSHRTSARALTQLGNRRHAPRVPRWATLLPAPLLRMLRSAVRTLRSQRAARYRRQVRLVLRGA